MYRCRICSKQTFGVFTSEVIFFWCKYKKPDTVRFFLFLLELGCRVFFKVPRLREVAMNLRFNFPSTSYFWKIEVFLEVEQAQQSPETIVIFKPQLHPKIILAYPWVSRASTGLFTLFFVTKLLDIFEK